MNNDLLTALQPTFAFWRNGRELASFSGADKQQLEQQLHELSK